MTDRFRIPFPRPLLGLAVVLALGAMTSCSEPMGPAQGGQTLDELGPAFSHVAATPGEVLLCKIVTDDGASGPYDFTVAQSGGREGTLPEGASVSLADGECLTVWVAAGDPPDQDPVVTVTVEEVNVPEGMQFDSAIVDSPLLDNPLKFTSPVAMAEANAYHGSTIEFFNSQVPPPPPPPEVCVGLTPGYWKNWRNHYTLEEFESLLDGTIASSATEAREILHPTGRDKDDPLVKLAKFVLANQLTLNLTGTDLPNPDEASLAEDCTAPDFDSALGEALTTALDMLANPGDYDENEILAVKDVLDAIANLGGDDEDEEG